jgi:ParB-like chromosome segregation protein Spo0J
MTVSSIPFRSPPVTWNNGRYDIAIGVVPVTWLKEAEYNPRTMSDQGRDALERGLDAFGIVDTLIACEDGHLLGGHQRLISERRRGAIDVPVFVVFGLTLEQRQTVNILLNNPSAQGQWDLPKLTAILSELDANGFDATLTGFTHEELAKLLGHEGPQMEEPGDADSEIIDATFDVVVSCASEADQRELLERLTGEGLKCRALTL